MQRHTACDPRVGELEQDRRSAAEEQHALSRVAASQFSFVVVHQYQLYASECAQAPQGVP